MEVVNTRDKVEDEQSYLKKQETKLVEQTSYQNPPPTATASPPSATTSPTHEFSFTISLHPHPPPKSTQQQLSNTYNTPYNQKTTSPSMAAIDLSPADDIFFHGHLLPLHLLPLSPRTSTNSMDSFTLPIKNDQNAPIGNTSFHCHHPNTYSDFDTHRGNSVNQNRPKSKSFSIFGLPRWKKECLDEREIRNQDQVQDQDQEREKNNNYKKNLKLEVTQAIKRYMKLVRPLLTFPKSRRSNPVFNRQPHSFSGNLPSTKSRGRPPEMRGQFSAPASMRTSPANSGILLASGTVSPSKSTSSDSTMEELQAAIQAAIAHCKNSIAIEDKIISKS